MDKNNVKVTVVTNKTGSYTLTCERGGQEENYLYYTPEELVIGMIAHVHAGISKPIEIAEAVKIIKNVKPKR